MPMRRWFATFLLVFLPLQFTWSVAAAYCQHESGEVQHFGHHEHKHASDAGATDAKKAPSGIDEDCAFCHAGCVSALIGVLDVMPPLAADSSPPWAPHFLASPPGDLPERPNWIASA